MAIPVIDISAVNIQVVEKDLEIAALKQVAQSFKDALMSWGFVYLTGHGLPQQLIDNLFASSRDFFALEEQVKRKLYRGILGGGKWLGYSGMGSETFVPGAPYDVKEAFDYICHDEDKLVELWPKEVPNFKNHLKNVYLACVELARRILYILGLSLALEDPMLFVKGHKFLGEDGNLSGLRTLLYPPIENKEDILPGQLRCSEHTDYGSITLLFQDDVGGLMVKSRDGTFVPATPVKDAVLLNIADLMQIWTNDQLISVEHKVIIPEEDLKRRTGRQSLAFFVQPDDACDIVCIDGSNKYPPVNSKEYLLSRFRDTYK